MIAQISCCMTLNIGNTYLSRSGIIAVTIGIVLDAYVWSFGLETHRKVTGHIWERKGNSKWEGTCNE